MPVSTTLNALEYRVMAHFADHHPPALEIVQVSVLGTAANLLPVPGAVVVRLANLRKGGVRMTRALNLTAIIGLTWVGSACILGGIANLPGHPGFGAVALAAGVSLMTVSLVMLLRTLAPGHAPGRFDRAGGDRDRVRRDRCGAAVPRRGRPAVRRVVRPGDRAR